MSTTDDVALYDTILNTYWDGETHFEHEGDDETLKLQRQEQEAFFREQDRIMLLNMSEDDFGGSCATRPCTLVTNHETTDRPLSPASASVPEATITTQAPKRRRTTVVTNSVKRKKPKLDHDKRQKAPSRLVVSAASLEQKIKKKLQTYRRNRTRVSPKVFNHRVTQNHTLGEDTKFYKTEIGCATHIRYAFLTPDGAIMFVCCKLGQDHMYHHHDQHGDRTNPLTFKELLEDDRDMILLEMFATHTLSKDMYQRYHTVVV
jgi:hypothetical protein